MTTPRPPARLRWWPLLLAALAAVLATLLSAGTASAATLTTAETSVGPTPITAQVVVGVHESITAGQQWGNAPPQAGIVSATGVATKPAIGFADDVVGSAFEGMRSGGGHAIRHLQDEGLVANRGSLATQVAEFEQLTSPILRSPAKTFDWKLGATMTRAFAGEAAGRQVVVFVAREGPYQGRVLSAVVPDAAQMAQWGLP